MARILILAALLVAGLVVAGSWWQSKERSKADKPSQPILLQPLVPQSTVPTAVEGCQIRGRVLDELQMPLAHCQVVLQSQDGETAQGWSNDLGLFRLPAMAQQPATLTLYHNHFGSLHRQFVLGENEDRDLGDLRMPTRSGLMVRVQAQDSQEPVADARLILTPLLQPSSYSGFAQTVQQAQAKTDKQGQAIFYGLTEQSYRLRCEAFGNVVTEQTYNHQPGLSRTPQLNLSLSAERICRGVVLDARGEALAGANLQAHALPLGPLIQGISDEEGAFSLHGLPDLNCYLSAEADGHQPLILEEYRPSDKDLSLRLTKGLSLSGQVLAANGKQPIAGAWLRLHYHGGPLMLRQDGLFLAQTKTDSQGRFRFSDLVPGILHVEVGSTGFATKQFGPAQPGPDPVTLELSAASLVTGKVLGPASSPLSNAIVQVWNHNTPGSDASLALAQVHSDEDGSFQLTGLPAGDYRLLVQSPGLAPLTSDVFATEEGHSTALGSLNLVKGARISGIARDLDGSPAMEARICLDSAPAMPHSSQSTTRSDGQGRFSFPSVPPGSYLMFYYYPDRNVAVASSLCRSQTLLKVKVLDQQDQHLDLSRTLK